MSSARRHAGRIDIPLEAQVTAGGGAAVEDVICLVLGEALAEVAANVLGAGVALDREIAAVKGVEKVKADRELVAKLRRTVADDIGRVAVHQEVERHFQQPAVALEDEAVLRHDQLERPGVVGHVLGELRHALSNPLPAPRPRFKPGAHAEVVVGHAVEAPAHGAAPGKGDGVRPLAVHNPVDALVQRGLVAVGCHPVDEIGSLIGPLGIEWAGGAKTGYRPGALAELDFILGYIDIDQHP